MKALDKFETGQVFLYGGVEYLWRRLEIAPIRQVIASPVDNPGQMVSFPADMEVEPR